MHVTYTDEWGREFHFKAFCDDHEVAIQSIKDYGGEVRVDYGCGYCHTSYYRKSPSWTVWDTLKEWVEKATGTAWFWYALFMILAVISVKAALGVEK